MSDVRVEKRTRASADAIWQMWVEVEKSPEWDRDVDWSRLHGPFQIGTRGEFKLKGGPRLSFMLDQVRRGQGYANTVRMPGLAVRFTHTLEALAGGELRVVHGAEFSGVLGWLLRPLARKPLTKALASALENMIGIAESQAPAGKLN